MGRINDGWRAAGLLLHVTSLPSPYGCGDLGPEAHKMAAFLKKAGLHFWQVLPLGPTGPGLGNSPYSSFSAMAGNPLLISPELMARDGWLKRGDLPGAERPARGQVDFGEAWRVKNGLIDLAFGRAAGRLEKCQPFQDFCFENRDWVNDHAFFMAAKASFGGGGWLSWPAGARRREQGALHEYGTRLARPILREKFAQFLFFSQLRELKEILRANGCGLIGDTAIYVNHDSSDVWSHPHLFQLGEGGQPQAVAGVPPDYFAKTGQLWGNPLFDWPAHRQEGFAWWRRRLGHALDMYDLVRLDHFRAFAAYWSVPAAAKTAAGGAWRPAPGAELFEAAAKDRELDIIAEDLGFITPDVTELRRRFGFPGMRVLQFAFGPDLGYSGHAPYRIEPDDVAYPGTHDNNTTRGWYRGEATPLMRRQISDLCGYRVDETNAAWALTRLAFLSPAALAVVALQDVLNLGEAARLNTPGTATGNWGWRLEDSRCLNDEEAERLANLCALAGRDNHGHPNTLAY